MLQYLAKLEAPKLTLWCYLFWYFAISIQYFDPSIELWLSSIGIAVLIGIALNIAASQKGQSLDRWVVIRLYIFPFCVSSYSALIKGQGFFLLFPTKLAPLLVGIAACCSFLLLAFLAKLTIKGDPAKIDKSPN